MAYKLSTEELKEKFGEIYLDIISQNENKRISCVRRMLDDTVVAYSIVTFHEQGIGALGDELHNQILLGKSIGSTIKDSEIQHERIISAYSSVNIEYSLRFLFDTKMDVCVCRNVEYIIKDLKYASIVEFYNPEFTPLTDETEKTDVKEECFVIDKLKSGFEEDYLKLTHGFLKKPMHVGIEDKNIFVRETKETLSLLMNDSNTFLFIAANGTGFVGYVALNIHPALHVNGLECVVRELYVLDEYQGKHVGMALMTYAEKFAKKKGRKRMSLATKWDDEKQRGFYESLGFSRRCDFAVKMIY